MGVRSTVSTYIVGRGGNTHWGRGRYVGVRLTVSTYIVLFIYR